MHVIVADLTMCNVVINISTLSHAATCHVESCMSANGDSDAMAVDVVVVNSGSGNNHRMTWSSI